MQRPPRNARGFTLIEMLTTIGIVLLLAALIVVALRGVRQTANRSDTSNALRQLGLAYMTYTTDHRQSLMPGYIAPDSFDATANGPFASMKVRYEDEQFLDLTTPEGRGDAGAYVWRLAPYLEFGWKTYCVDYRSAEIIAAVTTEIGSAPPILGPGSAMSDPAALGLAHAPSFGLNSAFVGGDDFHGGDEITDNAPWKPTNTPLAAGRMTEVKQPARLTLFAPSEHVDQNSFNTVEISNVIFGSAELRPPMLDWDADLMPLEEQWQYVNGDVTLVGNFSEGGGIPVARWGNDTLPIAHLDGSVTSDTILDLATDLRKWSPFEAGY